MLLAAGTWTDTAYAGLAHTFGHLTEACCCRMASVGASLYGSFRTEDYAAT